MTSRAKKRVLTGALFAAFVISTAFGFTSGFGVPIAPWLALEACLTAGVIVVVAGKVADWAGRDD